ncbi:MAG: FAD-dependent oxidoreductase [Oscillospiraceae bacterium]|nr:FAD-dependent oxidoreductase [Oscillospiraceae bacterium]
MKYVIIGNSAAGVGCIEGIRQVDREGEITVISNEPYHTYSRPLISYLLYGKTDEQKMKYRPDDFYEKNNVNFIYGNVTKIDSTAKTVEYETSILVYDKLLVATGSRAFVPPFAGLDGVAERYTFMSLNDAKALEQAISQDKRVLIVGAGLIGLKCAEGIAARVKSVTVADLADRILPSILDEQGAGIVQRHIESKGIKFKLSANITRFEGNTAILDGGDAIDFDILVLAVGVRPNTALLGGIADIDKGIIVNEKSETSAENIYAAGDCTQTIDASSGKSKIMALLPNAYMQGEIAGLNMAGFTSTLKPRFIPMNAIGFFGLHIITAGGCQLTIDNGQLTINKSDNYRRFFVDNGVLRGYILIGNVEKAGIYTSLIREQIPLVHIDFELLKEKPGLMAFSREDRAKKLTI